MHALLAATPPNGYVVGHGTLTTMQLFLGYPRHVLLLRCRRSDVACEFVLRSVPAPGGVSGSTSRFPSYSRDDLQMWIQWPPNIG
ncbi:hypothetical protein GWI33_012037 [Rhynchophorus ferrugineus]|uniref:Uncharacterized protein n=1 Tax=Rhynchophorus ferrugineus TaxID=354439 RepID=A0A834I8Z1_RHYFE|nr:hypothetical protein GWI33_012037 [Rhynchophorus ferrugineus]